MLIVSMTVSLDGYIADADGGIDWTAPDAELFQFHTDRVRTLTAHLCGRRLYETMLYWEQPHARGPAEEEFAALWQALPKVVFSRTLESVEGNARLAGSIDEELARLGPDDAVEVGGAGLAAEFTRRGLIDEYRLFVAPVLLGGGTPYFPPGVRADLKLEETRTFADGQVVYLRLSSR